MIYFFVDAIIALSELPSELTIRILRMIKMFFDRGDLKINILSVLSLSWRETNAYAAGRPFDALSYRNRGNADFTYSDKTLHVQSGDVIFVPRDLDYHLAAQDEELTVVHFEIENAAEYDIDLITPVDSLYFKKKFDTLYELWSKKQLGYEYECVSVLYRILAKLYRQKCETKIDVISDVMNDAVEYIHDRFRDRKLNIAELSAAFGMSDTYFRRLFVSSFGTTPLKYINSLRVSYALELLRSGYFSVEEVAEKSGFDNQKYLSTVIKKQTGKTPTSFRIK